MRNDGLLLVFYVMLVVTMFIEVSARSVLLLVDLGRGDRALFLHLSRLDRCGAAAVRERGHIRIDVIMHYVGPRR
jgi:hypothetical protein